MPSRLEKIQLPPGYRVDDLDDLPSSGVKSARNRYFDHIRAHKQWKQGIQGYLASIYFADAMLGRVLDALEKGPHAQNTIVVLWSDHGWQYLGEKEHWQKVHRLAGLLAGSPIMRSSERSSGFAQRYPTVSMLKPVNLLSLAPTLLGIIGPSSVRTARRSEPCSLTGGSEGRMASRFLDPPSSPREFWLK